MLLEYTTWFWFIAELNASVFHGRAASYPIDWHSDHLCWSDQRNIDHKIHKTQLAICDYRKKKNRAQNTEKDHTQRIADVIYNVFLCFAFFLPEKRHLEMQLWKQQDVF